MMMIDAALLALPEVPELKQLDKQSDTYQAFRHRLEHLKKEFPLTKQFLTDLDGGQAFLSSIPIVRDAQVKVWDAEKHQFQLNKVCAESNTNAAAGGSDDPNNNNKAKMEAADAALAQAQATLTQCLQDCERLAIVVLDTPELSNVLSAECDHDMLVHLIQLTVLIQGKPEGLAAWCDTYEHDGNNPIASAIAHDLKKALLHDGAKEAVTLLLPLLESGGGGPRQGQYGRCLEIYHTLLAQPGVMINQHPVLKRLALAVALEHAAPYTLFGDCGKTHPYRRFDHYARAYCNGELDPVTSRYNVWELRKVVDSDAPDEALTWGRISLQNYRPDLVGSNDTCWRYCQIVRTDVAYGAPKWYKEPRSYDQILSGGGKCGPRAWYGRFICKAFGIATWGCKQPAHAAMARWTYDGWQPCLGGGLHKSWWDNQTGNDFVLETKARNALDSETAYATKVDRLHWIAICWNEKKKDDNPDVNAPWLTLSTMQRQRLSKTRDKIQPHFPEQLYDAAVPNKVRALIQINAATENLAINGPNGTIVVPAGTCKDSKQAVMMRQYDAGGKRQVWLKENGCLIYDIGTVLKASSSCTATKAYSLTVLVCTVHKQEEKIVVKSLTNGDTVINIPYTMGYWQETPPVTILLDDSGLLHLERTKQAFGVSIKEVRLVPKLS